MDTTTGRVTLFMGALVLVVVTVWAVTHSPGWSLLALAVFLVLWERAYRFRFGAGLRFVPVRPPRRVAGARSKPRASRATGRNARAGVGAPRLRPGSRRPLWNRPSPYTFVRTRRPPQRPAAGRPRFR
jgi:hypothetical protein